MRTAVPEFAQLVSPLHHLLEAVYDKAGGERTKRAAAQVALSDAGWNGAHIDAFKACKAALEQATTLAHPSLERRVCLYTGCFP
jgi:hypothetical protein